MLCIMNSVRWLLRCGALVQLNYQSLVDSIRTINCCNGCFTVIYIISLRIISFQQPILSIFDIRCICQIVSKFGTLTYLMIRIQLCSVKDICLISWNWYNWWSYLVYSNQRVDLAVKYDYYFVVYKSLMPRYISWASKRMHSIGPITKRTAYISYECMSGWNRSSFVLSNNSEMIKVTQMQKMFPYHYFIMCRANQICHFYFTRETRNPSYISGPHLLTQIG